MIVKKTLIKNLKENEIVDDIFVVKFKKPVEQYKNGFKFELRLADSSGEIMFKFWGPNNEPLVQGIYDSIKDDDVVYIQGRVNQWNERLEISSNNDYEIHVVKEEEYDAKEFIRKSEKSIPQMLEQLNHYIDSIQDEEIKKLANYFFKNESFVNKFKIWPAAMYIHHAWIGGLLEHTLNIIKTCDFIHKTHFKLNRDLMFIGALFHDIGKLKEFEISTTIKVTDEGMMIGHVMLGLDMVNKAMEELNVREELRLKIRHMILTHMGEYGSTKTPSIPEALALYYADKMDGDLDHMQDLMKNASTDDDYIYTKHYGNIYLK